MTRRSETITSQKFEPVTFYIKDNGNTVQVKALPRDEPANNDSPLVFDIIFGDLPQGVITRETGHWESDDIPETVLVKAIGNGIEGYYP